MNKKSSALDELNELYLNQKRLEKETETHREMIKKLQAHIAEEGIYSMLVDSFPYPIAIYDQEYTVTVVNKAFDIENNMQLQNTEQKSDMARAVTQVFSGKHSLLEDVGNPFSIFGLKAPKDEAQRKYNKVVVFPIADDTGAITHGVIMFLP